MRIWLASWTWSLWPDDAPWMGLEPPGACGHHARTGNPADLGHLKWSRAPVRVAEARFRPTAARTGAHTPRMDRCATAMIVHKPARPWLSSGVKTRGQRLQLPGANWPGRCRRPSGKPAPGRAAGQLEDMSHVVDQRHRRCVGNELLGAHRERDV